MIESIKKKKYYFIAGILVLVIGGYFGYQKIRASDDTVQYVTATVEKGTLISSVSVSGIISSSNYADITTNASGSVKTIFAKDGDTVQKGDKLLEIDLDQDGLQTQAKAYAAYLAAQNSLSDAYINKDSLQSSLSQTQIGVTTANQTKISLERALNSAKASLKQAEIDYATTKADASLSWSYREQKRLALEAAKKALELAQQQYDSQDQSIQKAELDGKIAQEKLDNADNQIAKAQADLRSASLTYIASKPILVSPISGKVSSLNVYIGMTLGGNNSNSSSSSTVQRLLSIMNAQNPQASINVSESDITKISVGQKATLTLDAFADKTFTGKVITIDRGGVVSSGVTNYPITVEFDTNNESILPNMSVTANIITSTKDNVLSVPIAAVHKSGEESTVQVMVNGALQTKTVEVGISSDEATEIISGINEGDVVIVSAINSKTSGSSSGSSQSIFSGIRTGGASGLGSSGGGNFRMNTGNSNQPSRNQTK